jgi:REP element-mobilizing transposase RayT
LGQLIGSFKTVSTKRINALRLTPGEPFWQRNYYEHVIRNEADLAEIREYILNNPARWDEDDYYPEMDKQHEI